MSNTAEMADGVPTERDTIEEFRKGSRGETFTTSHGSLHFVRSGTGPLIILLHDLGASHASFDTLAPRLREKHQVCAVDLLGHGGSSKDVINLSISAQAEALAEIMTELRVEDACLVGHSLGGSVAVRTAELVPERVGRLVLLAAGSYESRVPLPWSLLRVRLRVRG